jgi:fibronectin-binding autotransporter adhesin
VQTATVDAGAADWMQNLAFTQFDPSLGTLDAVLIGISGDLSGSIAIENLGPTAASFFSVLAAGVTVDAPGGALFDFASGGVGTDGTLAGYDGTTDYAGASGVTAGGLTTTFGNQVTITPVGATLAAFTGAGTVTLAASASADDTMGGPASLQLLTQALVGATVSLQYEYSPPSTTSSGGGSYGGVFDTVGGTGAFRFVMTGSVTTAPQTIDIAAQAPGWTVPADIVRFNPALGTLESVNLWLDGTLDASLQVENTGPVATGVSASVQTPVTIDGLTVTPTVAMGTTLAAYGGTMGFTGPSAATLSGLVGTAWGTIEFGNPADLTQFTGLGTFTLPVTATGTSGLSGGADMLSRLVSETGAELQVSYTYLPAPTAAVGAAGVFDGTAGNGAIDVTAGTTLATGAGSTLAPGGLDLGAQTGATGTATVSGAGALLSNVGTLVIGDVGLGTLAVTAGGTVQTTPIAATAAAIIAALAGSDGSSASVNGAGSNVQITGGLDVGAAAGSLSVTAGGLVTAATLDAGVSSGASGIVSVVGTGSELSVTGNVTLGDGGIGELSVLTGATLSATGNAVIGSASGSSGNVDLEGAGSKLSVGGTLSIGGAGLGVLTVGAGATLHAVGLVQGGAGILNIAGGVVDPTDSTLSGPTDLSNGGVYQDLGTLTLKGSIVVDAGVGTVAAQAIKGHGSLVIGNDGTLALSDANGGDFGPVAVPSSHPSVVFLANTVDAHPTLAITDLGGFGATVINGFTIGDVIDLPDLGAAITAKALVNANTVGLYGAGETLLGALVFDTPQAAGYALGTAAQFAAGQAGTIEQAAITVPTLPG